MATRLHNDFHEICSPVFDILPFGHVLRRGHEATRVAVFREFYIESFMRPVVQDIGDLKTNQLIVPVDTGFFCASPELGNIFFARSRHAFMVRHFDGGRKVPDAGDNIVPPDFDISVDMVE